MTAGMLADDEGLLTKQDAADLVEMSLSMLRRRHRKGTGPPCLEISRLVRYRKAAVNDGRPEASRPDPQTSTAGNVFSQRRCANHTGICGTGTEDPPLAWQPFAKTNGAPCSAIMRSPQRCRMAVRTSSATSTTRRRWRRA
jgi:hypothetical protein